MPKVDLLRHKMTLYKLFIFDRHCACIYTAAWNAAAATTRPGEGSGNSASQSDPSSTLPSQKTQTQQQQQAQVTTLNHSTVQISGTAPGTLSNGTQGSPQAILDDQNSKRRADEEEAKLVYGVVFSLKNIINKLSRTV